MNIYQIEWMINIYMKILYKFAIMIIKSLLWLLDSNHRYKEEISMDDVKKFTHIIDHDFKSDFGHVSKAFRTVPYEVWELKTETKSLYAADKHRIIKDDDSCVWIEDLKIGDIIKTNTGLEKVTKVRSLNIRTHMYCVQVKSDDEYNHLYYTDGILSHNTETTVGYMLWKALFTPDYTILITANNYNQALEIMGRVRYSYENIPNHIKAGSDVYNKGSIEFDNGSRIVSRATTPNAGRGLSVSLLYCDEFAALTPRISKDFWAAIKPVLSCVTGDTLVLTKNGYRRIEDFHKDREIGEYFEISDLDVWGKNGLEKVSHGYVSPESDTFIIETEKGFKVEVTPEHPLYVFTKKLTGEMIKSNKLVVGDLLRINYNMNIFGNNNYLKTIDGYFTDDLAYMIGGWIAEGWISTGYDITISNTDPEFRNYYLHNTIIKKFRFYEKNPTKLHCFSKQMVELYKEIGIDPTWKCDTKQIPDKIWNSSKNIQCSFLRGLFDGDGSISKYTVSLSSTSRKLLGDVQIMLSNFGIVSIVRLSITAEQQLAKKHILPSGKLMQSARDSYSLTISRSQFIRFEQDIGFSIKRKKEKLSNIINNHIQNDDKILSIPKNTYIIDFIEQLIKKSKKTQKWFRQQNCRIDKISKSTTKKGVITYKFIRNFISILESIDFPFSETEKYILSELTGNFLWDRIKKITPSKNKTYDFTVPGTHSFLQNGILGSNTGGSCIITSTPQTDVDQFAQLWKGSIEGTIDENGNPLSDVGINGFHGILVPWHFHPDRDDAWAEKERSSMGEAKFRQEHNAEFVSDQETLIHTLTLDRMNKKVKKPEFYTGTVRWYHDIEPRKAYLVALDPSLGTENDYAAIQVFQLPEMIQVAEWQSNNLAPRHQVRILREILLELEGAILDNPNQNNDPEIFWTFENNSIGEAILTIIEDTGEERFPGQLITERRRKGISTKRIRRGLNTTSKNKLSACGRLKSLLESDRMLVYSNNLLTELKNFIPVGNTFKAKQGEHDDLISSLLMIVRMLDVVLAWENVESGNLREYINDDGDDDYNEDDDGPLPILFSG